MFVSFLAWPAHAITHGLNPFFSSEMGYPKGVNLLANTSETGIGLVLAPVTWLFGPVATLNVAVTLSPAISALAMFVLLRRWISWTPAAFFGGLFYGFSPYIIGSLTGAHLMLGLAFFPPLFVLCLDELLFRQRARPIVTGLLLGLLITLQFFIGTESLLIVAIMSPIGLVVLVVYAAWKDQSVLRRRWRYAATGLAVGAATAVVLLAYPAWFALDGPAHFSGPIWQGFMNTAKNGTAISPLFEGSKAIRAHIGPVFSWNPRYGGYPGTVLSTQYFGPGVFVVLLAGLIIWWRDLRLIFWALMAAASGLLSLGTTSALAPWGLVSSLPLFDDIIPLRFIGVTYFAVAIMIALIVEHTYVGVNRGFHPAADSDGPRSAASGGKASPRWLGALSGVAVAVVAIAPPAAYLAQNLPITTEQTTMPAWFKTALPHLKPHQVLLFLPYDHLDSALLWQSDQGFSFTMVNQGGPGVNPIRAGKASRGAADLEALSNVTNDDHQLLRGGDVAAIREALREWGVTQIVMPDQADLPAYDRVPSPKFSASVITAATGQQPSSVDGSLVWTGLNGSKS